MPLTCFFDMSPKGNYNQPVIKSHQKLNILGSELNYSHYERDVGVSKVNNFLIISIWVLCDCNNFSFQASVGYSGRDWDENGRNLQQDPSRDKSAYFQPLELILKLLGWLVRGFWHSWPQWIPGRTVNYGNARYWFYYLLSFIETFCFNIKKYLSELPNNITIIWPHNSTCL